MGTQDQNWLYYVQVSIFACVCWSWVKNRYAYRRERMLMADVLELVGSSAMKLSQLVRDAPPQNANAVAT